jgi:predicted ATP-grasp superfamily ATP-dependent carboligase
MIMDNMTKQERIMWQIYIDLFKAATPSADFEELVKNSTVNERGQKEINFMDYSISKSDYDCIMESNLKGKRLTKLSKQMITNSINLGCSPRTIQD